MSSIESKIVRKGLELCFSNVGFTVPRAYPEWLEEARSRADNPDVLKAIDWAIGRLAQLAPC